MAEVCAAVWFTATVCLQQQSSAKKVCKKLRRNARVFFFFRLILVALLFRSQRVLYLSSMYQRLAATSRGALLLHTLKISSRNTAPMHIFEISGDEKNVKLTRASYSQIPPATTNRRTHTVRRDGPSLWSYAQVGPYCCAATTPHQVEEGLASALQHVAPLGVGAWHREVAEEGCQRSEARIPAAVLGAES